MSQAAEATGRPQDSPLLPPKTPPHSLQAEQSVLGGLMLDAGAWDKIAERVNEADFYRKEHRLIFGAIQGLMENDSPCDVVTVSEVLENRAELKSVGGLTYLASLVEGTPSAANITAYADIVRERAVLRQLAHVGTEIADTAFHPEGREVGELLEDAEQKVFRIADQRQRGDGGFKAIKHLLIKAVDRVEELHEKGVGITGVGSGFVDLDHMTAGFQPADLVIVAGRPSMGKTTFAMNIAEHVAIKEQMPVAVFSMEMPGDHLAMRMMSSLGRIDQHRLRIGQLEDDEWPRMTSALNLLAGTQLFIDDTPALTPVELRARSRRLAREHGQLGLVVIDYLQLMQAPGAGENRTAEISEISRSLKGLAKELNVPVIALSQLNRNLEQRPNKRPVMSDLRESGSIEQDADVIVFVYRDEVYNEDSPDKGTAEIIIGKQRNGPIGTVRLTFLGQYTRFENFAGAADEDDGY
ncbi:MAG: replicative DNA helicase [Methylohalobius crimeensis]